MSVIPNRSPKQQIYTHKVALYSRLISIAKDPTLSYDEIAKKLNSEGFKTGGGNPCNRRSVENAVYDIRRMEKAGTLSTFLGRK